MANLEMRDNFQALYQVMDRLYQRNPAEWKKERVENPDEAKARVRAALDKHAALPGIEVRDTKAIHLALEPNFHGDRVATLVYGIGDMLLTAHGGKKKLYLIDGLDAQQVYNASRNIEIAMDLLAKSKDEQGQPLLHFDDLSESDPNLRIEPLLNGMIGRTDLVAEFNAEKYRRAVIDYAQSYVGGQFLQFLPIGVLTSAISSH
jgi:hypothetical protein